MSLLDHPEAQALLDDATVSPDSVRDCSDRLTTFLQRGPDKTSGRTRKTWAETLVLSEPLI